MVLALVSMIDSITSFPSPFITAIAIASLCTSIPIYLMSIRVLLSVELCVTLKTYLKGAPFYNASCCRKYGRRSAHRALMSPRRNARRKRGSTENADPLLGPDFDRSEEHTSELQSLRH